jgi:hypothetical protein
MGAAEMGAAEVVGPKTVGQVRPLSDASRFKSDQVFPALIGLRPVGILSFRRQHQSGFYLSTLGNKSEWRFLN